MVHRRMRSAPFRSCSGNVDVKLTTGLSRIAGGQFSDQITPPLRRVIAPKALPSASARTMFVNTPPSLTPNQARLKGVASIG